MEDLTLAIVTLMSFVLLFVVAIFADRAGADLERIAARESVPVSTDPHVGEESDAA
jgi:hypothetical protein